MNKKKFYCLALSVFTAAFAVTTPVFAEGEEAPPIQDGGEQPVIYSTFEPDRTGTLTLRYFDDNEETIPVAGAEFEIFQVATIGRDVTEDENGKYLYLDETLVIDNAKPDTDPYEYEKAVEAAYAKDPNLGFRAELTVNDAGIARFENLPAGAYLIRETKAIRYHIKSQPFVASVPETNDEGNSWNFNVVVNPKQVIAGDLTVEKQLTGDGVDKSDVFTMKINIAEGSYKALFPDGTEREVVDGEEIRLKGGQKVIIYDLPSGTPFKVVELEENKNGYKTTYSNQEGSIPEKTEIKSVVTNHKDSERTNTGAGRNIFIPIEIGCGALTLLICLLYWKQKNKAETAGKER